MNIICSSDKRIKPVLRWFIPVILFLMVVASLSVCRGETLTIPDHVNVIEEEAFCGDKSIYSAILPDGVEEIGARAFANTSLRYIVIPESVKKIASDAFENCPNLKIETSPESDAYRWADFYGFAAGHFNITDNLIWEHTENGITILGTNRDITDLVVPETIDGSPVTEIGYQAFKNLNSLRTVQLPSTLVSVGMDAFKGASGVTKLVMPSCLDAGTDAFCGLTGLTEVTIPVDLITATSFSSCTNVQKIVYTPGTTGQMASRLWYHGYESFLEFASRASLTSIVFEDGITHIADYAYYDGDDNQYAIAEIRFPNTLVSIGAHAFQGIRDILELAPPSGFQSFGEYAFAQTGLQRLILPEGMEIISAHCFEQCAALTEVTVPQSMKEICAYAFNDCTGLKSVPVLLDGYTTEIDTYAFAGCVGLNEELTVPETIAFIGPNAFSGCTQIRTLVLGGDCLTYDSFQNMTGLTEVTIPVDLATGSAFTGCTNVRTIHYTVGETGKMPDRYLSSGGTWSYDNCLEYFSRESLEAIDFEEGITCIGKYAFNMIPPSSQQTTVIVVVTDETAGNASEGYRLTSVGLPSSLEKIGEGAFRNLPLLKKIRIEKKCTQIGADNFRDCPELLVSVNRYNTTAIAWLINNRIPYYLGGYMEPGLFCRWLYSEEDKPLFAYAYVDGGLKPYKYQFTLKEDDLDPVTMEWQSDPEYREITEDREGHTWWAKVRIRDAEGTEVETEFVQFSEFNDRTDEIALRDTLKELLEEAPEATSLRGYMLNENMEDYQWLNKVLDLLHLDLSVINNENKKSQYLFEQAFKISAAGAEMNVLDEARLPEIVKFLKQAEEVTEELFRNSVIGMIKAFGYKNMADDIPDNLFTDFYNGQLSDKELYSSLIGSAGMSADGAEVAAKSFKTIKKLKSIKKVLNGIEAAGIIVNDLFKIYNQIELVQAIDINVVRVILSHYDYLGAYDNGYNIAADRLWSIVNTSGYDNKVRMIITGTLADTGIDMLLKTISLSDGHPIIGAVYYAADLLTGADSYTNAMYQLEWASHTIEKATHPKYTLYQYTGIGNTIDDFMDHIDEVFYDYVSYMEMAASVEEAYVGVCEWEKETPLAGAQAPENLDRSRDSSEKKAKTMHSLSAQVLYAKKLYEEERYPEALCMLNNCIGTQHNMIRSY